MTTNHSEDDNNRLRQEQQQYNACREEMLQNKKYLTPKTSLSPKSKGTDYNNDYFLNEFGVWEHDVSVASVHGDVVVSVNDSVASGHGDVVESLDNNFSALTNSLDNDYMKKHWKGKDHFKKGLFNVISNQQGLEVSSKLIDLLHLCAIPQNNKWGSFFNKPYGHTGSFKKMVKILNQDPTLLSLLTVNGSPLKPNDNLESQIRNLLPTKPYYAQTCSVTIDQVKVIVNNP